MARPLLEVISVSIFPKSLPCQVYGDIFVYDEDDSNRTYKLYQRDFEHPEFISKPGQLLLLTSPDAALHMPKPVISIQLMDRNKDRDKGSIASGIRCLDNTTSDDYEQVNYCLIEGDYGSARVTYIAIACALVGEVNVYVDPKCELISPILEELNRGQEDHDDNSGVPVYGTVVAHYGMTYGRHTTTFDDTSEEDCMSFTFLKTTRDESIPFYPKSAFALALQLTRKLVAVPAYGSLIIQVDLKERNTNKEFLCGTLELRASQAIYSTVHRTTEQKLSIDSPSGMLSVTFFESPSNYVLQPSPKMDRLSSSSSSSKKELPSPKMDRHKLPSSSSNSTNKLPSPKMDRLPSSSSNSKNKLLGRSDGESLLQVYSVFIGRENDSALNVFGTIRIKHRRGCLYIFNRKKSNADKLLEGAKLLTITRPPSHTDIIYSPEYFYLEVKLEDVDGRLLVDGSYYYHNEIQRIGESFSNQLLCTVIYGELGYCAIHYTNFSRAVRLSVRCVVSFKSVDTAEVYGRIVAWYDMFNYAFEYDKKYYQIVLFEESEDNAQKLVSKKKTRIRSSKYTKDEADLTSPSYIAKPIGHSLCIEVDVYASSHPGTNPAEHFQHTLQYRRGGDSPMTITGKDFDILVYVDRKQVPRELPPKDLTEYFIPF